MKLRVLVLAAVLAFTLAACGSSSGGALPKLSATPSATKTTTGTLLDNVPTSKPARPKDVKSKAGAVKFGTYVFDVVFYTLATNDSDALVSIADKSLCTVCASVVKSTAKHPNEVQVSADKHRVAGGRVTATSGDFYTVRQRVTFPKGSQINKSTGKVTDSLDAATLTENINMQWRKGAWVLLDYKNAKESSS
jgi:hypothetical protein